MTQTTETTRTGPIGFALESEVEVRQDGEETWETLSDLKYQAREETLTAPAGQETDFASVPRLFVWFLPRYGSYTKAAILHDFLCRQRVGDGLSRSDADGIFRQAMRTLDVPYLRRWIMWAAVRLGALTTAEGRKHWLRASWGVFPIALLALPVVLPPAVVIVVALLLFFGIEVVFWLVLLVIRRFRPGKKVNKPNFLLKL
jgi:hypothetical protein